MRAATWGAPARATLALTLALAWPAQAQTLAYQAPDRGPRFLLAAAHSAERAPVDVARTPILKRRLSLALDGVTLKQALAEISLLSGLQLVYSDNLLPADGRVHLRTEGISVAAALTEVLLDTDIDVVFESGVKAALVRRPLRAQVGTIVGRVADVRSGEGLEEASVRVEGTDLSASTGPDGSYRIPNAPPDTFSVSVRRIGYVGQTRQVTVVADGEVTVDFALEAAPTRLDELVTVTPGGMQTQVKALPSPITVITSADIEALRPQTINDVFRQLVPSAVGFDNPIQPIQTTLSIRGSSSISASSTIKIFVDGVEASVRSVTPVDPASIERIEVIRGPQAATLYGPDAAAGVLQIFTKKGDPGRATPQLQIQAQTGVLQTPYDGFGGVLRQQYNGSVRGGGQDVTYNFGGSYTRLADWLPQEGPTRQSSPSLFGAMRYVRGIITADLSARYLRSNLPIEFNPSLGSIGYIAFSKPQFSVQDWINETYGARFGVVPTSWWRNQLTLGVDLNTLNDRQTQPRLTTPEDTLFTVGRLISRRASLQYNSAITARLNTDIAGTLTVGIDHYRAETVEEFVANALNTTGTIQTTPESFISLSNATITNTGYLAQAEANWRETLFLTAGLRADANSTFGEELGTPIQPRVGLSMVRQMGEVTVKLRGAYGRAIRAPAAGLAFGSVDAGGIRLANPLLAPERQRGWDVGVDVIFGNWGSLSATGYDQTAEDLIVDVTVATSPVLTLQFVNLGRVTNRGLELEGSLNLSPVQLNVHYGYLRSRVEDLGPGVPLGASVRVGDRPLGVPKHTGGATLSASPMQGTTFAAGLTYVGGFRQVDFFRLGRCFGGTGPCPDSPGFGGFISELPGFAKVNASVTQAITRQLDGFVSVDNLTNNLAYEGTNSFPQVGRLTSVGLSARF